MDKLHLRSARPPFDRAPLARKAVGTLLRVEAMGLLPRGAMVERLDRPTLDGIVREIAAAGIAAEPIAAWGHSPDERETLAFLDRLDEALEGSPVPDREWRAVDEALGRDLLSRLAGAAPASVQRYLRGERTTPDAVAARLHFLALVIGDLAGTYNDIGVRRWFSRPRERLGGKAPADLLAGDWSPDDAGPRRVRDLARALQGSPVT